MQDEKFETGHSAMLPGFLQERLGDDVNCRHDVHVGLQTVAEFDVTPDLAFLGEFGGADFRLVDAEDVDFLRVAIGEANIDAGEEV